MINKMNRLIYFNEYININGIEQYLLHCGTSYKNPVMLFIHCSGFPESMYAYKFQKAWEENFTIVHFDQRGTGKTFSKNQKAIPTIENLVEDTHEIIKYLKKKYKKEKVIIFGHSLGTLIGTVYVQKYPEDVAYYIGTGQVISFKVGEHLAYEEVKKLALRNKDNKTLAILKNLGDDYPKNISANEYFKDGTKFNKLAVKYGLVENYVTFSNLKDFFRSPIFKWSDVIAMIKSGKTGLDLFDEVLKFDIRHYSMDYKVPIYYILGEKDWQTPSCLAKRYMDEINAPRKKVYMIPNGGHAAVLSELDKFYDVLEDIRKRESKE